MSLLGLAAKTHPKWIKSKNPLEAGFCCPMFRQENIFFLLLLQEQQFSLYFAGKQESSNKNILCFWS